MRLLVWSSGKRKASKGTLYISATHTIFVENHPEARQETWVSCFSVSNHCQNVAPVLSSSETRLWSSVYQRYSIFWFQKGIFSRYKPLLCVTRHSNVVSTGPLRVLMARVKIWTFKLYAAFTDVFTQCIGQSIKARQLSSTSLSVIRELCSIVLMRSVVRCGYSRSHDVSGYTVTRCCSWLE